MRWMACAAETGALPSGGTKAGSAGPDVRGRLARVCMEPELPESPGLSTSARFAPGADRGRPAGAGDRRPPGKHGRRRTRWNRIRDGPPRPATFCNRPFRSVKDDGAALAIGRTEVPVADVQPARFPCRVRALGGRAGSAGEKRKKAGRHGDGRLGAPYQIRRVFRCHRAPADRGMARVSGADQNGSGRGMPGPIVPCQPSTQPSGTELAALSAS